jgi:hypothetical protein
MRTPIPELITRNIEEALRGIRRNAGYSFSVTLVERRKAEQNPNADIIVCVDNPGTFDYSPYPLIRTELRFTIVAYPAMEEGDVEPADAKQWKRWADVQKALMADRTRGGLAERTEITALTFFEDGISLAVSVWARMDSQDPTKESPTA